MIKFNFPILFSECYSAEYETRGYMCKFPFLDDDSMTHYLGCTWSQKFAYPSCKLTNGQIAICSDLCPIDDRGFNIKASSTLVASPNNILDGEIVRNDINKIFKTRMQQFPWVRIKFEESRKIYGIHLHNLRNSDRLIEEHEFEIRIGNSEVDSFRDSKISLNTICANYKGVPDQVTIKCNGGFVEGSHVSIQIVDQNSSQLVINEVTLIFHERHHLIE